MRSNQINPRKLIHSKWTAAKPLGKAKHFIVTEVEFDQDGLVTSCLVEAVLSKRVANIQWKELKNQDQWIQGWK